MLSSRPSVDAMKHAMLSVDYFALAKEAKAFNRNGAKRVTGHYLPTKKTTL
jgi:hypothetical protein